MLKFRSREGAYIARTYDALDRRLTEKGLWTDGVTAGHASSRSWRMRDATFSYWLSGRMISAATDQVTKAWTYDTAGRPVTHTASTPAPNAASYTFTYGWDVAGNLTSVGYPTTVGISGIPNPGTLTATYAYDALNRMTGVTTTGIKAASASLTYDTLSRRKSVTFGDNSTQAYDYEADDDLSSIAHTFVTAPATHNVTLTYSNDKLGRQISETTSNSLYLYDPPLAATGAYGAATSLNQYPTVGSTTYSYTPNDAALLPSGSVTSDGVRAFFYDEKGNLTKARQGADSANDFDQGYFDALGVRWYSYRSAPAANDTSRIELTDGLRPEVAFELHSTVAEGSTTPVVAGAYYSVLGPNPDERLIWINGTETSLKARYPHTNRRGDTIAMGRDGIAETKFKYGPFGESADSTAGYPWRFTGQRLNGWTGLYHFKARAYAPGIGRFLQPDPIGYEDGPNIYAYLQDDPYNSTDPTGTQDSGAAERMAGYNYGSRENAIVDEGQRIAGRSVMRGLVEAPWIALAFLDGPEPGPADAVALAARQSVRAFASNNILRSQARTIFAKAYGKEALRGGVQVHHRIPLQWKEVFGKADPNRLSNLIGLRQKGHNIASQAWQVFARKLGGKDPTQAQVMEEALRIDKLIEPYVVRRGVPTPPTPK